MTERFGEDVERACAAHVRALLAAGRDAAARDRRRGNGDDARRARPRPRGVRPGARPRPRDLRARRVDEQLARLAALPVEERRGVPGSSRSARR